MALLTRALVFIAVAYLATLAILYVFQSRFIYPAPQEMVVLADGYEEIFLQTSDGLTLRSFYRPARDGLPTIVYFHGNAGTLGGSVVSNGAITEAGMGALLVEYRGYGGNSGDPSEEGLYRDGEAAMAWLAGQGIDPEETIIIGNSIGSGIATEMAVRHDPRGLILVAPFTTLHDAASERLWVFPVSLLMSDHYDSLGKIRGLSIPLLIQHGTADTMIPQTHGRRLAEVSLTAEFQSYDGAGHELTFRPESQLARRDWILALEP